MNRTSWALVGLACLATTIVAGSASAQTSEFDSLTCVNVTTDRRFAQNSQTLTLTPEDAQLMESRGCRVIGGTRIARADALCYPTEVSGGGNGGNGDGVDLSGQAFLCYDVRCQRDEMNLGNVRTELTVTDRFGDGTIFVNERPTTKRLCVPATIDEGGPTATPRPTATPNGSPSPIQTPGGTPTPGATATPGSASLAFVEPAPSLLH